MINNPLPTYDDGRSPRVESAPFQMRAAGLLRSAANDLKRDTATAAEDLGIFAAEMTAYFDGQKPITLELLRLASEVWPVNLRDLLPYQDDAPEGVLVMSAEASLASGRTMARGGMEYYEYRDTAMSRIASYRPEWIRMLCRVENADPANPRVRWNRGHLLYQFTYFVGPVNYYNSWKGRSRCTPMQTGDSVWGVPYAPHSFTSRSLSEPAYILALTYGDELTGPARSELAVRARSDAAQIAIAPVSRSLADPELIRAFMQSQAMSAAALSSLSGISGAVIDEVLDGRCEATPDLLAALAAALRVSPRDLLPVVTEIENGVRIQRGSTAPKWPYPSPDQQLCTVKRLAGDSLHPSTCGLEVEIEQARRIPFTCLAHQYLFVLASSGLAIIWSYEGVQHRMTLADGDSAYVKPCVDLQLETGDGRSRLLALRIGSNVSSSARYQLGAMASEGLDRYIQEDGMWFDDSSTGAQ
jgi:transcriptional regulator with XRE-family HTH domain